MIFKQQHFTGILYTTDLSIDHFKATTYLQSLNELQIRRVGGALGLTYDILEKMKTLPDDMVAAWLRREGLCHNIEWRTNMADFSQGSEESGTRRNR